MARRDPHRRGFRQLGAPSIHTGALKSTIAKSFVVCVLCAVLGGASFGCYFLFTLRFCDIPGNCGASGNLLESFEYGIIELSVGGSGSGEFIYPPDRLVITGGLAFSENQEGELRLFVGFPSKLIEYDGFTGALRESIPIPDCELVGDIVVLNDGDVIVGCYDTNRLVRLDPNTVQVVEGFACCP